MSFGDTVNSFFEGGLGVLVWHSIYRLYKDKEVKGFSMWVQAFVTLWGYWNCWYYPSLGQWFSFTGGVLLAIANTIWFSLALYYLYQKKSHAYLVEETERRFRPRSGPVESLISTTYRTLDKDSVNIV